MPSSRPESGQYIRQNSSDIPPPLIAAAYPTDDGPHARFNPNLGRNNRSNNVASSSNNRQLPSRPVNRSNTVRGAVKGTIREKGSTDQAYIPARSLTRGKTLTRPDRFVAPAPLIDPSNDRRKSGLVTTTMVDGIAKMQRRQSKLDFWGYFVYAITFYAPAWALSKCAGITDKQKQRAWKEKVALCSIALMMGTVIAFLTIGLTVVLCPVGTSTTSAFTSVGTTPGLVGIQGFNYNVSQSRSTATVNFIAIAQQLSGQDTSGLFQSPLPASCNGLSGRFVSTNLCIRSVTDSPTIACPLNNPTPDYLRTTLGLNGTGIPVGYDWNQVASFRDYMVLNGNVLNLQSYMLGNPNPVNNDLVDSTIRYVLRIMPSTGGKDATKLFSNDPVLAAAIPCLKDRYYAGDLDKISPGCFVSHLFLYVSLALILAVVFIRFFMAFYFRWFLAHKLIQPPRNLRRKVISPSVLPEGANIDINNTTGSAPWSRSNPVNGASPGIRQNGVTLAGSNYSGNSSSGDEKKGNRLDQSNPIGADGMISMASIGAELFVVCLVTAYSEGEDGIRTTLDSLSATHYSDARKLMFIVCDGMVTGDGEKLSTPDICVGLIERDERFGEPLAMTYDAVGEGSNAANMAMVYAGHYVNVKGRRIPALVVVKTGLPSEATEKKPGNRGKRDSQMILMSFFSRVTYNDNMSPLDYDLFRKVQSLMGVTPDFFEVCLMVDADTKVYPDSLGMMIRCMQNDNMIMGLCGETRIANKRQSWVTMIQVFEYFISHHLSKAFESVFGGVNCLPGCFSMYRLKTRKAGDGDWVPVLVQPQVISEYSQSTVVTLHQKNLLLLGEDRFLTTLLLRTFPNRKMVFCPQARCRTVVPDTFSVLLSQRRRWINSTVHNLMELVLVRNLCGTFCFSMQFVIFIDLIGTVVLPVAICLTYYIAISYIVNPPGSFADAIPLLLLGAVLGLPAVLIVITTFKLVYVGWMLIYLVALPIWNFVLPVYAFSKFDDFSWGETRKVTGETKGDDIHGRGAGRRTVVPRRKWEDWERQRLKKIRRDAKRKNEFERAFGSQRFLGQEGQDRNSTYGSDTTSVFSSEEDQWGHDIGDYLEEGSSSNPPPLGLYVVDETDAGHETYEAHELEAELERGWDEETSYGNESTKTYLQSNARPNYPYDSNFSSPPLPARVFSYSANGRPQQHSFADRSTSSLSSVATHEYDNSNSFYAQQGNGSNSPLVPPPLMSGPNGSQGTFSSDLGEQYSLPLQDVRRRSPNPNTASYSNPASPAELLNNPFDEGRGVSPGGHNAFSRR